MPDADLCGSIGRTAKEARRKLGFSQGDVADSIGLAQEVYGRLERGHMMPSVPTLRRVCVALGISADEAFGFNSSGEPRIAVQPAPPRRLLIRRLIRRAANLEDRTLHVLLKVAAHMVNNAQRRAQQPKPRRTKPD